MQQQLETWTALLLKALEFLGLLLAVGLVAIILLEGLRAFLKVTGTKSTLVLPFTGGNRAAIINLMLADQLNHIEQAYKEFHENVPTFQEAPLDGSVPDLGPVRLMPEDSLDNHQRQYIATQPVTGQAIGPISLGPLAVSPDAVFAISYKLRDFAARSSIRGTMQDLGAKTRISASFTYRPYVGPRRDGASRTLRSRAGRPRGHADQRFRRSPKRIGQPPLQDPNDRRQLRVAKMSRAPYSELLVLTQDTSSPEDLLRLVDNVAFRITRLRLNLQSGTDEWDAYLAFQHGYAEQMSFLRTSDVNRRDAAVIHYTQALQVDTDYHLAHYNLANVLYNRYTQEDNARAGAHFMAASDSADGTLRALALAGLTVTYAQNTHRFGLGDEPWTTLADATSEEALALAPKLEESVFARAWAHQISGRTDAAIEYYTKVMELDGSSLMERQIKSYALNNRAYLLMYDKKDIDQAEQLLLAAPDKNKMTYANLAEVCKRRRMYSRALDYFEKARILDPRYVNAINETAIVYVAMAAEVELDKRDELLAQAARWHKRALYTVPAKALDQRRTVRKAYDAAIQAYSVVAPLSADILADPPVITQDGSASAELLLRSTRVERT